MFLFRMLVWNILFLAIWILDLSSADRVVMTNNGPVQGITVSSGDVEAFLGIPYAEPPVGRLRFLKPVTKTSWLGVYDASRLPPPCIQNVTTPFYYTPDIRNMSEDCLYLNIWVPHSKTRSGPKTIIFYIYGGAFNLGGSNMDLYDGARFAAYGDVVVVTINYRVGVMGFFSAFIEGAEGNMGIYDQILALKWIRANAYSFGGDPESIVLMGESAGAMSIGGHILSPLTRNMFKRVILQSGAAISPLILDDNARLYDNSQKLASLVGCADKKTTLKDYPDIIVKCLKRLTALELSSAEGMMKNSNPVTFVPRVGDSYLPKTTVDLIQEGHIFDVEMLTGVNKDEGTFFLTAAAPQYFGVYGIDNVKTISKRLAFQMARVMYAQMDQPNEKEIADFYINSVENGTSDTYTKAIADSMGDFLITCDSIFHADFHSLRNPVYFYKFSHRPSSSPLAEWMGTTHFDEVQYVFGNPMNLNFTAEEARMNIRIMDRWLAFAKTGNPNIPGAIKWPRYNFENPEYLDIDIQDSIRLRPSGLRCEFWRERFQSFIDDDIIEKLRISSGYSLIPNNLLTIIPIALTLLVIRKAF